MFLLFCICVGTSTATFAESDRSDLSTISDTNTPVHAAQELLTRAIQDAGKRLQRQNCAAFFGPDALKTLTSAEYKLMRLGPPRFVGNAALVTAARTIYEGNIVMINLDGPFVTPRLSYGGRRYRFNGILTGSATPTTLSDAEFRVVILLHELGHLLGSLPPDTNDLKQNRANNQVVLSHCFGIEDQS